MILDASSTSGGAWTKGWDSLKLFSPREYSSLSGFMMPKTASEYPTRNEMINYLGKYEQRYGFRIERPVLVQDVEKNGELFSMTTNRGRYRAKAVVSATGTFTGVSIPELDGIEAFAGIQMHSSEYRNNKPFKGMNVAVIGGGNSGSQILAEISEVANTHWFTNRPLQFLDDDQDGRYLFELSTQRYNASLKGEALEKTSDFWKVVMTESVKAARERGVLTREEDIQRLTRHHILTATKTLPTDAIVWCTGFAVNLDHLNGLKLSSDISTITEGSRSKQHAGLWLVGYGEWSGYASATIIGVQKHARITANQISEALTLKLNY